MMMMMMKSGQMNEMKEMLLHFLLMMKIFENEKIFANVYYIATMKKYCFSVTIQKLFIISDNPTFAKEKFLNYKKL